MTAWTFAGSNPALSLHNTGSAALTTHGVGNLIVLINTDHSTTDYPSGVSSSRVTWTKAVPDQGPNTNGNISESPAQWAGNVWFGTVNSVGSDTVTFSYTSGTTPTYTNATAIEVTSPTGNWSLDSFAVLNSSSGTSTWPSVTPANSGTLVFGFAWNFGSAVSGSTSGYTYNSNADTAGNGYAYNLNAAGGTSTAAVWGDSTETYGIVVAVSQSPSGPSLIPGNELDLNTQSIETDASDWSALTNCSVAQSSAHAFDGTKSLAITATSSGTVDAIVNSGTVAFPAVTPGNPYQFFFAAYTTSSGINASANGDFYNVSTFVSSYSSPTIALIPNTWTWVSVTGIAPATSTLLRPIPQFTATAGGQVVYIDSVFFGPPPTAISAVGTAVYSSGTTISLNPATAGNFYVLMSEADGSGAPAATGVSGGNCTWRQLGGLFTSSVTSAGYTAWLGTATTGGTATATVTFNGATTGGNMMAQQFSSSTGSLGLDGTIGTFSSATTVAATPSRTPAAAGELYVAFSRDTGTPTAGSTSGYAYQVAGTHYGLVYNVNCTSSAQAPTWGDSGIEEAIGLLLTTAPVYSGTGGQLSSPARPGLAQPGAFIPGQPAFAIPITVWNGQLTAAATAHASFGGTKTALGHFTAAATAHETAGGTRTTFGHLTTAVTAHMAATGTRTTFGSLTTTITAHAVTSGTRTTFGSLTTTATAHMTAAGTKTGLGSLTSAATAHMTAAGTKTALGHLTSAATAAAAFTGTRAKFGTLTTAAAAHAAFSGTRTTFGSLATAATAHMTAAGTKTALGHLTTTATAHAAFTGTRTQFGSLTAAATAHAVFAGTKTGLGSLASSATAHMAAAGTKTALGHLTTAATAAMAISSTGGKSGALTTTVTSHVTFTGTKTALGHLTTVATAHAAFTGTRTQFGHLTTTATAHAVLAGTKTGLGHLIANATASAGFHAVRATTGSLLASVTAHLTASAVSFLAHQPRNLGGTVIQALLASGTDTLVPNPYGGTIAQANLGGGNIVITLGGAANTVANVLGGTISDPGLGGTLTSIPFGGGVTGWTMQNVNLNFAEFNDITLNVTITSNGSALNLTGYTVNMLLKPLAGVLDSDGRVLTLSSSGGSPAITITNAATGACTVAIPHTDLQDETHTFYRIDAVDGSGNINTAIYGNITYTSL